MTITFAHLPQGTYERLRQLSELTKRPIDAELVRAIDAGTDRLMAQAVSDAIQEASNRVWLSQLSQVVEPLPGGSLTPTPPILTDEGPAPCTIPLAGPSVVVEPLSGGQLRPTPPIFLDVEKPS